MIRRRRSSSCARSPAVRHHLDLLRKPTGKNPRQPRKPLSTDGGPLGARLNCDREFWILLRFFESRRGHGLVPAAYRGDGNQQWKRFVAVFDQCRFDLDRRGRRV